MGRTRDRRLSRERCIRHCDVQVLVQAAGGECTWADGEQRCKSVKVLGGTFLLLSALLVTFHVAVMFLSPRFAHGSRSMRRAGVFVYVFLLLVKGGIICVTLLEAKNVRSAVLVATACVS